MEQEKSSVQEKLQQTQHELSATALELERSKRDANAHAEQDKHTIAELQQELKNFRAQFDDAM